uniref:Exonuclease domain-containing protein n=1 Tax=Magallana gigas TaxID=29159 RepID=A0A8W8MKF3_MAGGI
MVAQNKHNPAGVEVGLDAMWKHPFGDHSSCSDCCTHKEDPHKQYKHLPFGQCLTDKNLQEALADIFKKYKSHSKKIAELGSYTQRLAVLRDLQHRKRKALNTTRVAKRRRLELKAKRLQKSSCQETREGKTYSPEVDVCEEETDLTFIPPPCPSPVRVPVNISSEHVPVYFDLETTGLTRTSHITQIAAAAGELHFSCYVFPRIAISSQSASVTGISVRNGIMYHHGKRVDSKSISTAVDMLLDFCQTFQKKIILVGHNVESFDSPILMYALDRCKKLESFTNIVDGFLDTFKFFRIERPVLDKLSEYWFRKCKRQDSIVNFCSGLQLKHLELAYSRDPVEGIYSLFSEQCGKSVRVSKSRKHTSTTYNTKPHKSHTTSSNLHDSDSTTETLTTFTTPQQHTILQLHYIVIFKTQRYTIVLFPKQSY